MFQKAKREKLKLRIAIAGPSGSGKTFTALKLAQAIAQRHGSGKVAVVDTEAGSSRRYADLFDFDVMDLDNHAPANYVRAIQAAAKAGYDVIVLDSLTHAWKGTGGVLQMVDKAKARGNQFGAWRDASPEHDKLVEGVLKGGIHIIATMRSKMGYEVEEVNGKKVPVKIGMSPEQRDGMEYEFDVFCDMNVEHVLTVSKTRCNQIDGYQAHKPGEEFAHILADWAEGGEEPEPRAAQPQGFQAATPPPPPMATLFDERPDDTAATDADKIALKAQVKEWLTATFIKVDHLGNWIASAATSALGGGKIETLGDVRKVSKFIKAYIDEQAETMKEKGSDAA